MAHATGPGPAEVVPAALPPDLLEYGFATLPSPLQVSTESADSPGAINLWVSAPAGKTVYCSKLIIAVPTGGGEAELCVKTPSLTPNTTWWAISSLRRESGEDLGLAATTDYAVFSVVCTSNKHWKIDYDLQFSVITSGVNHAEGKFGIVVVETSGETENALQQRRSVYELGKGPSVGYLSDVVATAAPPGATDRPASEFAAGQPIRLAWESNAAGFAVYAAGSATPVWTGTDTSHVIPQGATRDTTFSVVATSPHHGPRTAAASVSISNPVLAPSSLAAGTLTVSGVATLAGAAIGSLTAGPLTATGLATLPAGAHATSATVTGGTTVMGGLEAASLNVTGTLAAAATANLQAATIAQLTVTGQTAILGAQSFLEGTYRPTTDGFVIGYVGAPNDSSKRCMGFAVGRTDGVGQVAAHGGNAVFWATNKDSGMSMVQNSFVLPVRKDVPFGVGASQLGGSEVAAPIAFLWIPLTPGGVLESQTADEAAASGLPPLEAPEPTEVEAPAIGRDLDGLLLFLAEVLGDRLTPGQTERLRTAVLALTARPYASNHPQFGASA